MKNLLAGLLGALMFAYASVKAVPAATLPVHKISDHFYVIEAREDDGSNVGVLVSGTGVLLIDTMLPDAKDMLLATLATITDKPVTHVISTHGDGDHTGANTHFQNLGAEIILQANVAYSNVLYTRTYEDTLTLTFGGQTVMLYGFKSHSFEDTLIHLPQDNVIFTGDAYNEGWHPSFYSGGYEGQSAVYDKTEALADPKTLIVPGHGKLSRIEDVIHQRTLLDDWINHIKALKDAGQSYEAMAEDPQTIAFWNDFTRSADNPRGREMFVRRTLATELMDMVSLSHDQLSALEGRYLYTDGVRVEIALEDGKLFARNKGDFFSELQPLSPSIFHLRGWVGGQRFIFDTGKDGKTMGLTFVGTSNNYKARRLKNDSPH
ncbi:MAG: MBL fold metallo-hydrolase [Alphaproteobacteria bacterium]|nr:MBL fold metallo-hydrolase [Alphaproteobacteria bacterium]